MSSKKLEIEIKEIAHGSKEYELEVALRDQILRKPLGLQFDPKTLAEESTDYHLGAFLGDRLIGCLMLVNHGNHVAKMRQVAVAKDVQGKGVGELLVKGSEKIARALGFVRLELHARETAVSFYTKLGYEAEGESFVEVKIPHLKMTKRLI